MTRVGSLSKEEMEQALNELFGLNIKWSRLPKKDLELLVTLLGSEARCGLCDRLGCARERYPILEIALKNVGKGPLAKLLEKALGGSRADAAEEL